MLPVNVEVNVKPVFAQLIHSGPYEGPCRVGAKADLSPDAERQRGRAQFETFTSELSAALPPRVRLLAPTYLEWHDDFVLPQSELAKLELDIHEADLVLMGPGGLDQYPAISIAHRYSKPVGRLGWVGSVDIAAYLGSRGMEGYAFLDYAHLSEMLTLFRVRKALQSTRMLVAVEGNSSVPSGVVSSIWDFEGLKKRYGVDYTCVPARDIVEGMHDLDQGALEQVEATTNRLLDNAQDVHMSRENVLPSVAFYVATWKALDKYECNAFTIPCFELCAKQVPATSRVTFCLTHTLLKDQGIPSACEADTNVLMAITLLTYLSRQSAFMGNTYLVDRTENILAVHHDVPGLKMKGIDGPDLPYELRPFTTGGWGVTVRYDFSRDAGAPVTLARFNPAGTKVLVAKGEIVGSDGFDKVGCSLSAHIKVRDIVDLFHKELDFGHHLAMVYGDYVDPVKQLGQMMGFEVVEA